MLPIQKLFLETNDDSKVVKQLRDNYVTVKEYPKDCRIFIYGYSTPFQDELYDDLRGLILSWDSKTVYSRPFSRFYNFNETDISHFTDFVTYQKLDGTLSIVWYHPLKQQWFFSTRKSAYATSINNFTEKPFRELMLTCMGLDPYTTDNKFTEICNQAGFDPHVTYMFESISPENTVVTPYEKYESYLIAARNIETGEYISDIESLKEQFTQNTKLKICTPKQYPIHDIKTAIDIVTKNNPEFKDHKLDEGFVCFNPNTGQRIKCKFKEYAQWTLLKVNITKSTTGDAIIEHVFKNDYEEYLRYLPELEKHFQPYLKALEKLNNCVDEWYLKVKDIEDRKELSKALSECPVKHVIFGMMSGITRQKYYENLLEPAKIRLLKLFL